jgi:hypothetical protein
VLLGNHLLLAEHVQRIDLFHVELEVIFVADVYSEEFETFLLFVELETECRDVHFRAIPICMKFCLELFLDAYVKRTPSCVKMLEDLDGSCVAIGSSDVLELAVVCLIKCITHVHCHYV